MPMPPEGEQVIGPESVASAGIARFALPSATTGVYSFRQRTWVNANLQVVAFVRHLASPFREKRWSGEKYVRAAARPIWIDPGAFCPGEHHDGAGSRQRGDAAAGRFRL